MEIGERKGRKRRMKCKPLFPHPAMLVEEKRKKYLVVTDLHIGFEEMFSSLGYRVEASVEKMLNEFRDTMREENPDELIILGDVKYSVAGVSTSEWRNVPRFLEKVSSEVKTTIIAGNHDGGIEPLLPRNVRAIGPGGLSLGDTYLLHGHALPSNEAVKAKRFIMGHMHPTYNRQGSFYKKPLWIFLWGRKDLLFKEAKGERLEIIVMPTFNRDLYLVGSPKLSEWGKEKRTSREKEISPIFRRIRTGLDNAVITDLHGNVLGGEESMEYIS